ncbi:MAG: gliding motility-associated C-terminal domain-containing protein, partial [Bacteroidetes bacterium]|nr:gliding motility-associated C-terminal domain-containing protein [Bacteroidota bacterium]
LLEMVDCNCYLFVPTGFTPNQDGVNDVFEWGYQCGFLSFDLQIFNRWGKLVYQTENPADGWDGRSGGVAVPEGVYAWRVVYSYEGRAQVVEDLKTGTVTVMR